MPIDLRSFIREVPDFPKPGILFRDITPLLSAPDGLRAAIEALAAPFAGRVDAVVGIESRGFLLGAPVALGLGVGLAIVRKPGKLPGTILEESYSLEYGTDRLQIHRDALRPGQRVLLIDDLLATGGTAAAGLRLIQQLGVQVVGAAFLIELAALRGRGVLEPVPVHSVIRYEDA